MRTKTKNVITGAVLEKTYNPTAKFPTAYIERREMQYLYEDSGLYYFMDTETYEPVSYTHLYGTGAIMAVPGHDQRDYDFAKAFGLPIVEVVAGGDISKEAFADCATGVMVNSGFLTGMTVDEAKAAITEWLEKEGKGVKKTNFKLRDWVFSRQRDVYKRQAVSSAIARGCDLVICDTAGRLHNKKSLMDELSKISRVAAKAGAQGDVETLLVLDAVTGQNAIQQAAQFIDAASATGIILTKLDGTSKGGSVISIKAKLGLPVRFVGVGEGIDDLMPFDPQGFVDALFLKTE